MEVVPPPLTHSWSTCLLGVEGGDGFWWELMPEPSLDNSSEWVTWRANQVDTLTWWLEMSVVPGEREVEEFVWKVWANLNYLKGGVMHRILPMITLHPHPSSPRT